jgi:hypothetical protein
METCIGNQRRFWFYGSKQSQIQVLLVALIRLFRDKFHCKVKTALTLMFSGTKPNWELVQGNNGIFYAKYMNYRNRINRHKQEKP